jgi:hypothetical protein
MKFAAGYKTYAIAAIAVLIGIDQGLIQTGFNIPAVPSWVIMLLGAIGLYSLRSGVTTDTQKAVFDVLSSLKATPDETKVINTTAIPEPTAKPIVTLTGVQKGAGHA